MSAMCGESNCWFQQETLRLFSPKSDSHLRPGAFLPRPHRQRFALRFACGQYISDPGLKCTAQANTTMDSAWMRSRLWSVSPRPSLRSLSQPLCPLLPRKALRKKMRAQMAFLMEMVAEGRRKQELGLREISWIWSDLMPHAKSKRVGCHQALSSTKSSPAGNRRPANRGRVSSGKQSWSATRPRSPNTGT